MPLRFPLILGLGLALISQPGESTASLPPQQATEFVFHRDHILGTSFDLIVVVADEKGADAAELAALDEIERLRLIFSTYDQASEISRLNQTRSPTRVSAEMIEVLKEYEQWQRKSAGAFNGQVGELVKVWKEAERANRLPSAATLERIARDLRSPGWALDPVAGTVTRLNDRPLNLNAIAKGFIIRKAADAIRAKAPGATGLLINLGGDILATGDTAWAIGIQDPDRHYDNAAPIAGLKLKNQAIASSGGYQRFYTIDGKRYSHIFDPRTGRPAEGVAGATVVAADNVTANALATTLCVLSPEEGLKLIASVPGTECLIIAATGKQYRSPGLKLFAIAPARVFAPAAADDKEGEPWPAGYQVTVTVELPKIDAKRYRRPYSAIWIEDDKGKAVRTLAVWGNAPKYLKDLTDWWKIGKTDTALVKAVTRATRGPGKYELVWDGNDDKGIALPQGTYTVRVEVRREFGAHLKQSGKIECRDKPASTKMGKNAETAETKVEFQEAKKK